MIKQVKRIALTLGEPAGIGPDIAIMLAQKALNCELVVFGCKKLLTQRASLLELPIYLKEIDFSSKPTISGNGQLSIYPIPLPDTCNPGTLNLNNANWVLNTLQQAYVSCHEGLCNALVTGPVHKGHINSIDSTFMGHTEYFATLANSKSILMGFYGGPTLVGLVTTHIPLKNVSKHITKERLIEKILLLQNGLQKLFAIKNPHIGVLGLNPHAGEDGKIGREEITTISPVINQLQQSGIHLSGPLSADTVFNPKIAKTYDAILAMYHDQGLGPIKAQNFGEIVNLTLGLPIIRTSVDHGTALSLAGTTKASIDSLQAAVLLATQLSTRLLNQ